MNSRQMRKLDAWIAEHVMGFKWAVDRAKFRSDSTGSMFKHGTICLVKCGFCKDLGWGRPRGGESKAPAWSFDVPHYTISPVYSLEVLKKCAETFRESISIYQRLSDDLWVIRTFVDDDDGKRREIFAEASTLELAICLFAKQLYSRKP